MPDTMKTRGLIAILSVLALVGSVSAAAPAAEKPADTAVKKTLQKGMTAEAVIELLGKPLQVKPMNSPEGKAEIWVYRRLANKWTTQTAATTDTVMLYSGLGLDHDGIRPVTVPSLRTERVRVYQVTSLLMFNGTLIEARQRYEKEREID